MEKILKDEQKKLSYGHYKYFLLIFSRRVDLNRPVARTEQSKTVTFTGLTTKHKDVIFGMDTLVTPGSKISYVILTSKMSSDHQRSKTII